MSVPRTDFELQHARMKVIHSEGDDLRLKKAALLLRSDALLEHRKALLADMREFAAAALLSAFAARVNDAGESGRADRTDLPVRPDRSATAQGAM
jgi:hypothetical protein